MILLLTFLAFHRVGTAFFRKGKPSRSGPFWSNLFFEMERMQKPAKRVQPHTDNPPQIPKGGIMPKSKGSGLSDNSIGALAYFTPFPAIFFLAIRRYNKRPYVRFHAWQSLVFSAFVFIFGYILNFALPYTASLGHRLFLGLWWLVVLIWAAIFLVWLWCVVSALNGKRCRLPIIGDWADEQAYR
jgi:uncharacterized membrane protein